MTQTHFLLADAPALGSGPDLTWMMSVVAVLVLAIGGLAFALRRVIGGAVRARASKRDLRVLDVLPLGGKRQLAVVRCYDRTFALGLGERSVDLVAELDSTAVDLDREPERATESFQRRLRTARERLLGEHEVVLPAAAPLARTPEDALPPSSTREFIA